MRKITLFLLVSSVLGLQAQQLDVTKLTYEDYQSDLTFLNKLISQEHPAPYKVVSKSAQEKKQKDALKQLKKTTDYVHFIRCLTRIGDGHLSYELPEEFTFNAIEHSQFFPYPVFVKDGRMFINIKGATLPYGTEITAINNLKIKDLLTNINEHVHGDFYNTTLTEEKLTQAFPLYFANIFDNRVRSFSIDYITRDTKKQKRFKTPAVDYYTYYRNSKLSILPINKLELEQPIHPHYYPEKKLAVLTVNTFDLSESQAYEKFSDFFKRVNKEAYKEIAIDLRNNGGGNPSIAALLYSFISNKKFQNIFNYRTAAITLTKENMVNDYGNPLSYDDIKGFENFLYQRFNKDKDGTYVGNERLKEGVLETFPPDKDTFSGSVNLLVSGKTFSAAVYFAKLFKEHQRGKIIGQETGGNEYNTFAGYFVHYKLPKTKIIVRIPKTELFFGKAETPKSTHGIAPDLKLSIQDYLKYALKEQDPETQYLLER